MGNLWYIGKVFTCGCRQCYDLSICPLDFSPKIEAWIALKLSGGSLPLAAYSPFSSATGCLDEIETQELVNCGARCFA